MIERYDKMGQYIYPELKVMKGPEGQENLGPEPLGSKRKFWALINDEAQPWLFKYARPNTGEHWAEKLGAELAGLLKVPRARVELAKCEQQPGVLVESIVPHSWDKELNQRIRLGELVHGNEILSGFLEHYDRDKQRGQTEHSYANIISAIRQAVPEADHEQIMTHLAGLLVLDAFICNTDRHHENWALLRTHGDPPKINLAPSYDHASSLGRELTDARREVILRNKGIADYVKKAHGAIFGQSIERHPESPIHLVRWALKDSPTWFHPWIDNAHKITHNMIGEILSKMPSEAMSNIAKDFCWAFLRYTLEELKDIHVK